MSSVPVSLSRTHCGHCFKQTDPLIRVKNSIIGQYLEDKYCKTAYKLCPSCVIQIYEEACDEDQPFETSQGILTRLDKFKETDSKERFARSVVQFNRGKRNHSESALTDISNGSSLDGSGSKRPRLMDSESSGMASSQDVPRNIQIGGGIPKTHKPAVQKPSTVDQYSQGGSQSGSQSSSQSRLAAVLPYIQPAPRTARIRTPDEGQRLGGG